MFLNVEQHNARVDRAARIHPTFAALIMLRNTLSPLRSNDLLCARRSHRIGNLRNVCVLEPDSIYKIKDFLSQRRVNHTFAWQSTANQRMRSNWRLVSVNDHKTKPVWLNE